ncbi:MAG: DegT/DnrJ/EryC1/StrS family aminotransferase [Idiomarina sp.]
MIPYYVPTHPDLNVLTRHLEEVNQRRWFTNFGPLSERLGEKLEGYLQTDYLLPVSNCTFGLMAAYQLLGCKQVVTTPFSFVATTASLKWMQIKAHFVDIDPDTQNICPEALEHFLSKRQFNVDAIVATHVYGNPCDVDRIESIAKKYGICVIYDAAHAFDVAVGKRSVLDYGDCSVLSFHATKIFHSVEGGAIALPNKSSFEHARKIINFGIDRAGEINELGINAKMSEYHAAAGLTQLDSFPAIKAHRVALYNRYCELLEGHVKLQLWHRDSSPNGAYMPIFLKSEQQRNDVAAALDKAEIGYKLYFSKNLNCSLFNEPAQQPTPVAESACNTVLCLPIYLDLSLLDVDLISRTVIEAVQ